MTKTAGDSSIAELSILQLSLLTLISEHIVPGQMYVVGQYTTVTTVQFELPLMAISVQGYKA